MLDPASPSPLDLTDLASYLASCCRLADRRLAGFPGLAAVATDLEELNRYPRLAGLREPRDVRVLSPEGLAPDDRRRAAATLLAGGVLLEHACAGEATRLGMGVKYLISPHELTREVLEDLLEPGLRAPLDPRGLAPLCLGRRHMLQLAWDPPRLAEEHGRDPRAVLAAQTLLIVANRASFKQLLEDFRGARSTASPPPGALHGPGTLPGPGPLPPGMAPGPGFSPAACTTMARCCCRPSWTASSSTWIGRARPHYLPWEDYQRILAGMDDKISYNIEDLDYLEQSLDLDGLALALQLGGEGFRHGHGGGGNNPEAPQKGGLCAFDPGLGRDVMIESFQLAGLPPSEIRFLNKNVNHYPRPARAAAVLRERGLAMPLAVKDGYLYFQPVQGDLNFLLPTAFIRRPRLRPHRAWQTGAPTPAALLAMAAQDRRRASGLGWPAHRAFPLGGRGVPAPPPPPPPPRRTRPGAWWWRWPWPLPSGNPLSYLVPAELAPLVGCLTRVLVPLRGRPKLGFALAPPRPGSPTGLKRLLDVLDDSRGAAALPPGLLGFFSRAAAYYGLPLGLVLAQALPAGLGSTRQALAPARRPGLVAVAAVRPEGEASRLRPESAAARLWRRLKAQGPTPLPELRAEFPRAAALGRELEARGLLTISHLPLVRDLLGRPLLPEPRPAALTADQAAALARLAPAIQARRFAPFLVEGVTGSGKTELYLAAAEAALALERQVLFLVPEIGLLLRLEGLLADRFGPERVAVLHSGLTPAARREMWRRIAGGQARLVAGARSAVFAPLAAPGLIVVDEEQDEAYKQEERFRYSARDLALLRGQEQGCPVVLGSATPSLASLHKAATASTPRWSCPGGCGTSPCPPWSWWTCVRRASWWAGF